MPTIHHLPSETPGRPSRVSSAAPFPNNNSQPQPRDAWPRFSLASVPSAPYPCCARDPGASTVLAGTPSARQRFSAVLGAAFQYRFCGNTFAPKPPASCQYRHCGIPAQLQPFCLAYAPVSAFAPTFLPLVRFQPAPCHTRTSEAQSFCTRAVFLCLEVAPMSSGSSSFWWDGWHCTYHGSPESSTSERRPHELA